MKRKDECVVCGKPLEYLNKPEKMECVFCHKVEESYVRCQDGHFVCDKCHQEKGIEKIMEYCKASKSKNPILLMQEIMENPYIYMHGPEHHVMVGAALITAYYNAGGKVQLNSALEEMKNRGSQYPGGSCGFWGCCGAAVSVGMALSIIYEATPLSGKSWGKINEATSQALSAIGKLGGPRCCKRNSFTSVKVAAEIFEKEMGVKVELPSKILCTFSEENNQCKKEACPYYQ